LFGFAASASFGGAAAAQSSSPASKFAMPGLYRGKVIAVKHPGSIVSGAYQREPVQQMIRRGMMELTGAPDWQSAWKVFFEPGDVVGIKLNPVGQPLVISSAEVVQEIITGLEAAGLPRKDIVAYDRYQAQFMKAGFHRWLPDGVRRMSAANDYDRVQQNIQGYDPDHFVDVALTMPDFGLHNETARRSYAAKFISKEVNKLINLPVLKDHQSAGITLALKNLSHGLVNNVNRSHYTTSANSCGTFIPAVVSMPVIRNKAVLHILDGVKGVYHGGPGARPQFVWEHQTMYFATDPVSLDRIGWEVIDAKRVSVGMKPLVEDKPDKFSTFVHRQPEHVEIAAGLGLGEWDKAKIQFKEVALA
jgi:uncharacterized protein (DUF362 family)